MPNNEEVKIVLGDCPKDCRFNGIGHGHCLKCGEVTQPVMKCEGEFRKPNNEDWIKQFDEELPYLTDTWGKLKPTAIKQIKSFILKLKSRWVEEERNRIRELYFDCVERGHPEDFTKKI